MRGTRLQVQAAAVSVLVEAAVAVAVDGDAVRWLEAAAALYTFLFSDLVSSASPYTPNCKMLCQTTVTEATSSEKVSSVYGMAMSRVVAACLDVIIFCGCWRREHDGGNQTVMKFISVGVKSIFGVMIISSMWKWIFDAVIMSSEAEWITSLVGGYWLHVNGQTPLMLVVLFIIGGEDAFQVTYLSSCSSRILLLVYNVRKV
ncbi:acyl-CoA synthetase [Sesbania bispinosa]|nr:acyl-CoA synthetase [Sesbania bispinosa]